MRSMALVSLVLAAAACSKSGSGPSSGGSATTTPAANDPCGPAALGLGSARRLDAYKLPDGCQLTGPGAATILRTDAEAAEHVTCGATPLGIDFATQALIVKQDTLSPATTGIAAYDDGKTLTWVSMQRSPCPDDPRPMPVPVSLVFAVEKDAARTFAETRCTYEPKCQ